MEKCAILGYDKDNDAYEMLCIVPAEAQRHLLASIIIRHHMHVSELRRSICGEPFDWFVITNDAGEIIDLYSYDHPNGSGIRSEE